MSKDRVYVLLWIPAEGSQSYPEIKRVFSSFDKATKSCDALNRNRTSRLSGFYAIEEHGVT